MQVELQSQSKGYDDERKFNSGKRAGTSEG